jgi:hypothetical protein
VQGSGLPPQHVGRVEESNAEEGPIPAAICVCPTLTASLPSKITEPVSSPSRYQLHLPFRGVVGIIAGAVIAESVRKVVGPFDCCANADSAGVWLLNFMFDTKIADIFLP